VIPPQTLYRIGYGRDPLAWPAPRWTGDNRFDDPLTPPRFRVLYAAEERRACFAEVLATQRPDLRQVAAEQAITGTDEPLEPSVIPASWRRERTVGWFEVGAHQRHPLRQPSRRTGDMLGDLRRKHDHAYR
jgi:hypothetical protein